MSDEAAGKPAKAKKEKPKKGVAADGTISLAGHPRATASIARLRSRFGLGAALVVAFMAHSSGVPLDGCISRGLLAGTVGYFVGWWVGVTCWRQLVRAELRVAYQQRAAALAAAEAEAT